MRIFAHITHWLRISIFVSRRPTNSDLCKFISFSLREPLRAVVSILRQNVEFLHQVEYRRVHLIDRSRIRQYASSFELQQGSSFFRLIAMDGRSRILATYHFGDFVYGMNYLVCLDPPGRRRVVLSQTKSSPSNAENMRNAFGAKAAGDEAQLIGSSTTMVALSALLRRGCCTLVMFCDLPCGFGEPIQVKFLDRIAWFPRGPATLAITSRTPLLPVINYLHQGINKIEMTQQIEPELLPGESFESAVARITQQLINYFEQYFVRFPEQWRYLQSLPTYFVERNPEAAIK